MSRSPAVFRASAARRALAALACAGLVASLGAAPASFAAVQPERAGRSPERAAAARDRFRERLASILEDLRTDQKTLEEIIKKLDEGAPFEELRPLIPDRLSERFRPPAEGSSDPDAGPGMRRGPGGDRAMGERGGGERGGGERSRSDQPFSDDDWEAVTAIIKHAQPEMLAKFQELRQQDAAQAQRLTLGAYPRLRPLLDLYKHDRAAFDLRLEEMVIIRESMPLAKEVIEMRKRGVAEESDEMKAARDKLRDLARRQVDNRLAIQRSDLAAMRKRLERREKELAENAASPDAAIERSIDGLIKQAERGDGPDRRGGGPRPEGKGEPPAPGARENAPPRSHPND